MDSIWSSQPSYLNAINNSPGDKMSLPFDQVPIDPVLQAWDNDQPSAYSVQTTFFNMVTSNNTINTAYSHNNEYPCSVRPTTVSTSHSPTINPRFNNYTVQRNRYKHLFLQKTCRVSENVI